MMIIHRMTNFFLDTLESLTGLCSKCDVRATCGRRRDGGQTDKLKTNNVTQSRVLEAKLSLNWSQLHFLGGAPALTPGL